MREFFKKTMLVTLATAMMLSAVSCKKPEEAPAVETSTETVQEVVEEVGFTTSEFGKDNYKRYWYINQNVEERYDELMKELTLVEGKFNDLGTHKIYVDKDGVEYIVNGITPVRVDDITKDTQLFLEKTGEKVRSFGTVDAKDEFIAVDKVMREYLSGERDVMSETDAKTAIINGVSFETPNDISVLIGADVPEEAIDFEIINEYIGVDYELDLDDPEDGIFEVMTSPMLDTGESIVMPVGINEFKRVKDEYGQYWSAKYETETEKLYIPVSVIKNLIGWDIVYCKENAVLAIVTDSVYGVAENEANLIGMFKPIIQPTQPVEEPQPQPQQPVVEQKQPQTTVTKPVEEPKKQTTPKQPSSGLKIDTSSFYEGKIVSKELARQMIINPRKDWGVEPDEDGNWILVDLVENARQGRIANEESKRLTEEYAKIKVEVTQEERDSMVFG